MEQIEGLQYWHVRLRFGIAEPIAVGPHTDYSGDPLVLGTPVVYGVAE